MFFFIFGNIVPLHKSYSDVGNMGSIFSATLQPILHVPGNIIIFGTEILECTQIVGKIRNRNIIIFSAKKIFFLTMSQSEKSTEIFDFGVAKFFENPEKCSKTRENTCIGTPYGPSIAQAW